MGGEERVPIVVSKTANKWKPGGEGREDDEKRQLSVSPQENKLSKAEETRTKFSARNGRAACA